MRAEVYLAIRGRTVRGALGVFEKVRGVAARQFVAGGVAGRRGSQGCGNIQRGGAGGGDSEAGIALDEREQTLAQILPGRWHHARPRAPPA